MIDIDDNVTPPMDAKPAADGRKGRPPRYPFSRMEVGQSFVIKKESSASSESNVSSAARSYGKRHGMRFCCRKEPGKPGYVRIWRIE